MAIAKEQLRQIMAENDINSVGDIYTIFKDTRDIHDQLQDLCGIELSADMVNH